MNYGMNYDMNNNDRLFHDGQHVAGVYGCAWGCRYFLDDSLFRRLDLVLHFHGFDYNDALAGLDLGIFR